MDTFFHLCNIIFLNALFRAFGIEFANLSINWKLATKYYTFLIHFRIARKCNVLLSLFTNNFEPKNIQKMENHPISTKKSAITYGLILGAVLALMTTLMYVLDPMLLTKWWIGILSLLLVIVIAIVSVAKAKGLQGGIMSFKEAFTAYFITVALGSIISTCVGILIFNIIDPEMAAFLQEKTLEITAEFMQKFGTPQAEIDKQMAKLAEQDNYSIATQLKNYVFGLAFMSVIGLLVALIFKTKNPNPLN